jgi:hypothetical protein
MTTKQRHSYIDITMTLFWKWYNRLDMHSNFHQSISSEISVPSSPTSWKKVSQDLSLYIVCPHIPENPFKGKFL